MADIFISYSKADHALALKLSAFLEAEGWSVWWDKSLGAADLYRDKIMKQLAAARAVITIWTPNSIKSDWVRAEAGAAKAQGKLIPVKTPDVAYADIPLPFGEMHTESVGSTELIRAAVVAQLAKPAVEPRPWALLARGFKYELLTWVGIVGGALTLFTNLGAVLKLADWATVLVRHWEEWTHAFWVWAFGWLGIHVPPVWAPVLSFLLFWALLTIGSAIKFKSTTQSSKGKYQGKGFRIGAISMLLWMIFVSSVVTLVVTNTYERIVGAPMSSMSGMFGTDIIAWSITPAIVIAVFARQRLHATISAVLFFGAFSLIMLMQLDITLMQLDPFSSALVVLTVVLLAWIAPVILLLVAPAKAVSRRLIFLALGVLLLIALNELSNLVRDLAPKLQG
jgi:hypothetical protein